MIVLSAVLVLVGLALLIAGLVSTGLALIYASLGVTVVAAILLLLGVRMTPSRRAGTVPAPVPAAATAGAASAAETAELEPVPAVVPVPAAVEVTASKAREEIAPNLRPGGTVVVVSGRPRYHRAGCRFLTNAGSEAEDITVQEARELGFTPCGVCKPDERTARDEPATDVAAAEPLEDRATASAAAAGQPTDTPAQQAADEQPPAATAPVKKAPAKKAAAKKAAPAKKAPAKKTAAKKAPAKKAAATKAAKKTAPAKTAAPRKAADPGTGTS
ncbi:MAG TPA: hypothetical protein VF288_09585 [Mycobacteriales bacterium]